LIDLVPITVSMTIDGVGSGTVQVGVKPDARAAQDPDTRTW